MYSNHLVNYNVNTTTYTEGVIVIDNNWHGTSVSLYILISKFSTDTCRNLLNLTKCELDGFDFLLANKDTSSL